MSKVFIVNVVFIVVGIAASAGGAKNCAICMTESQSMMFCTLRGTVGGVLRMLEDAVVGETTSFARTGGNHRAHNSFIRTVALHRTWSIPWLMLCRLEMVLSEGMCPS
jgi:hypothetical protein